MRQLQQTIKYKYINLQILFPTFKIQVQIQYNNQIIQRSLQQVYIYKQRTKDNQQMIPQQFKQLLINDLMAQQTVFRHSRNRIRGHSFRHKQNRNVENTIKHNDSYEQYIQPSTANITKLKTGVENQVRFPSFAQATVLSTVHDKNHMKNKVVHTYKQVMQKMESKFASMFTSQDQFGLLQQKSKEIPSLVSKIKIKSIKSSYRQNYSQTTFKKTDLNNTCNINNMVENNSNQEKPVDDIQCKLVSGNKNHLSFSSRVNHKVNKSSVSSNSKVGIDVSINKKVQANKAKRAINFSNFNDNSEMNMREMNTNGLEMARFVGHRQQGLGKINTQSAIQDLNTSNSNRNKNIGNKNKQMNNKLRS